MKKIFTTFLGLFLIASLYAQISITSADMPNSGDTIRYSTAGIDAMVDSVYQVTGANITWDFSQITATGQGLDDYVPASSTPYSFFFLGGNKYGLKIIDTLSFGGIGTISNVYDFYKNSTSAFEAEGRGMTFQGFSIPAFYSDKDEIYLFPLDTADRDSTTFDFTTTIPFIASYITKGYRINEVNGWGTIMTPFDTLQCIRVVTDIVSTDSINVLGIGGFSFPNHTRKIKWLANGVKTPMMQISGNVVLGAFIPTEARYRDIYRGIQTFNPLAPTANFEADNTMPEATIDTVTFSPSVLPFPGNTYSWAISPNTFNYVDTTDNTSDEPKVVFNAPGLYSVSMWVSTNFGSDDTTKVDYINVSNVSIANLVAENGLKIFPNPVLNGKVNMSFELSTRENVEVTLMDVQGRIVKVLRNVELNAGVYQEEIKLGDEFSGFYLLNVRIGEKQQTFQMMID